MAKSDYKFVNFSEEYELDYIANQYEQSEEVKKELEKIYQKFDARKSLSNT